jgi:Transposase DDE domain
MREGRPREARPRRARWNQDPGQRVQATMRAKIKASGHASPYRLRKQLPEPVFGQIKQARGFRQFLLRGFANVRAEWAIVCTVHNLLKLAAAKLVQRWSLSAALPPALAAR